MIPPNPVIPVQPVSPQHRRDSFEFRSAHRLQMLVYVGCYTTAERNGHGEGISVYRIDCGSDNWKHVQLFKGLLNPSLLALDRHQRFLYSAHGDADYVSAFSIDRGTGELSLLNQQSTGGKHPVHLVTDPTNRFLIVANYGTGSVAALPIKQDG